MRHGYLLLATATIAAVLFAAVPGAAQVYVTESYYGDYIFRFDVPDDTTGVLANPDTGIGWVNGMSFDALGNLLLAVNEDVLHFDPDTQAVTVLDTAANHFVASDVFPDTESSDIYVVRNWELKGRQYDSQLQYLPSGEGPAHTAYEFADGEYLMAVQVWPFGNSAGNILVLSQYPDVLMRFERIAGDRDDFDRLDDIVQGDQNVFQDFTIMPDGRIIILDYYQGMFVVDDGTLQPFGDLTGGYGYGAISAASDGTVYVTDQSWGNVRRFDEGGSEIFPPLGQFSLIWPEEVVAPGFTPAIPGEDVPVSPVEGVEILFEEVVEGGYTTAFITESLSRTSPRGNRVPVYADAPTRQTFSYVDLGSETVYSNLIQVEVYLPGSRMFFAHASGDTFRDVTITGSIDDARGVISRFSEVVLVEDSRPLSTVIAYKFEKLINRLTVPMPIDNNFCPTGAVSSLMDYAVRAEALYDQGLHGDAITLLSRMNERVRALGGWCIPDESPDNTTGDILALSKTLMYSLGLVPEGPDLAGAESPAALSLAVTSPSRDTAWIELAGPVGSDVSVRVFNTSGRLVSTLFEGRLFEGQKRLVWDGKDDDGMKVASGVYFVLLEVGHEFETGKLVLIR